ncbi:MAG: urate hydroxylase PuuD [Armatimonadota bacterium]|nr:urate hydroxylase PuuD [Armatimonadota bacterium]
MDPYWQEWLHAVLRWIHVIAGIMWIGDSLLFMWIDSHLAPDPQGRRDVTGVTWLLHGGGYYQLEKRLLVPGRLPPRLRWFWLEATTTWLSGALLLVVVYYASAEALMVEPGVSLLRPQQAVAAGVGLLVVGWVVYDGLWRSALGRRPLAGAVLSWALLALAAYAAVRLFSARAAFLHVGALLGTLMAANVWVHILPPQWKMLQAARRGEPVDHALGAHAKARSTHNTYMTFPAIFLMLSNHFPGLYAGPHNWLVLALLVALGAAARHVMLTAGRERAATAAVATAAALALLWLTLPARAPRAGDRPAAAPPAGAAPAFAEVRAVIARRCAVCHSETPTDPEFLAPAGGLRLETPRQIRTMATRIRVRAVQQRTMPPGNRTGMTEEERALLQRWIDAGAPLR